MRTRHTQHHESLRSNSTNIAIAVSAAMPGLIAADVTSDERWVLTGFLMLVNVYRLVMSLKHNERSKLHFTISLLTPSSTASVPRISFVRMLRPRLHRAAAERSAPLDANHGRSVRDKIGSTSNTGGFFDNAEDESPQVIA